MKVHLLVIDPQNDFCIGSEKIRIPESSLGVNHRLGVVANGCVEVETGNRGALVVPGAEADMNRLAALIDRVGGKLDDITVTLDSHQRNGIERPSMYKRVSDGAAPGPFTILGIHSDRRRVVRFEANAQGLTQTDEEYTTILPGMMHRGGATGKGFFGYLEALEARKRYPHVIWPNHCCVGSWGWGVVPNLDAALGRWELNERARINYVPKGNNPDTEHFSAVGAEVPDPRDPSTQLNTRLIQSLEEADIIALAGEARSHCLANSVRDVVSSFSNAAYAQKMVILTDATSDVPGFESFGTNFIKDMVALGAKTSTCADFLA